MINKIKVAVVGAGTMGNGIAHVFALSKISEEVILIDLNAEILELAEGNIVKNLTRQLSKNFISKNQICSKMESAGFKSVSCQDLSFGISTIFIGYKLNEK